MSRVVPCEACGTTERKTARDDEVDVTLCGPCWKARADAQLLDYDMRRFAEYWRKNGGAPEEEERSGWEPVDLRLTLEGDADPEPPPKMLGRSDGECLLYAGKVHLFAGEPEGAKGWLAMLAAKERIAAGEHALYIDFEDEAAAAVDRLVALGVDADAIDGRFHYVRPDEPLNDAGRTAIERILDAFGPTLAVIDGLTDGLAIHGIDLRDNTEVANWMRDLPQGLRRRGIATVINDHVVKDGDARGRYSIGAQHKLAKVDVAYHLNVKEPLGRGLTGRVLIRMRRIALDTSGASPDTSSWPR
jgi:hypothetical protein